MGGYRYPTVPCDSDFHSDSESCCYRAKLAARASQMSRLRMTALAAVVAVGAPFTAHHEGLRLKAYLDPVGIPTICYGETENVAMGDVKSREECDSMLTVRLAYYAQQIGMAADRPLPVETHAALASWTYNVGVGAMKKSTLVRKLRAGDIVGACNQLPRWNMAGGRVWAGLVKRREAERQLCLKGIGREGYHVD
jgi:lysozyme